MNVCLISRESVRLSGWNRIDAKPSGKIPTPFISIDEAATFNQVKKKYMFMIKFLIIVFSFERISRATFFKYTNECRTKYSLKNH